MITKERLEREPTDRFDAAGMQAERQLAHYLKRSFGDTKDVLVFNDLRVVHEGEVAQIDHLLLHRSGMIIIESKSVTTEIAVNRQGEFTRTFKGKRSGMPSPIEQAKRQAALLRTLLDAHKASLLPKSLGLLQQGFSNFPIEILIAISDSGIIKHQGKRPEELMKADAISDRIQQIVSHHTKGRGFTGLLRQTLSENKKELEGAGLFNLKPDQLTTIAQFLLQRHEEPTPRQAQTTQPEPEATTKKSDGLKGIYASREHPACKHCSARHDQLCIEYGKYGYYFRCKNCQKATGIDLTCTCAPNQRGRIRKSGPEFSFECSGCSQKTTFFRNQ